MSNDSPDDNPVDESPLDWLTTEEMLDELFRRYEHCIFAGLRAHSEDENSYFRKWKGNAATCAGLGQMVGMDAISAFNSEARDAPE